MGFIKSVATIIGGAVLVLVVFAVIGYIGQAHDEREAAERANAREGQEGYFLNRWVVISCRANDRSVNCNHPIWQGVSEVGDRLKAGKDFAAYFNFCGLTEKDLSVVGFDGRCHVLMSAPAGQIATNMSIVLPRSTGNPKTIYNIPFSGTSRSSVLWDSQTAKIIVNYDEMYIDASEFGGWMRHFFVMFSKTNWIINLVGFLVFSYLVFLAYQGAFVRGKNVDQNQYAAYAFSMMVFFMVASVSLGAFGDSVLATEKAFIDANTARNQELARLEVPGVGYKPYTYRLEADRILNPNNSRVGFGEMHNRLVAPFVSLGFVLGFLPALALGVLSNWFNVVGGIIDRFSRSRHEEGYSGVRAEVTQEMTKLSAAGLVAGLGSVFTAPFKNVYSQVTAFKNRSKADELRTKVDEVQSDIEVSDAELRLNVKKQHLADLQNAIDEEEKALDQKRRG